MAKPLNVKIHHFDYVKACSNGLIKNYMSTRDTLFLTGKGLVAIGSLPLAFKLLCIPHMVQSAVYYSISAVAFNSAFKGARHVFVYEPKGTT